MTQPYPVGAKHKFVWQTISVLLTRFLMLASGLLASIILARSLGSEGFGVYTAIFAVIYIILSFADLGIRQAITYTMGQKLDDDQAIVSSLLLILLFSSIIGMAVTLTMFASGPTLEYGWLVLAPAVASIPLLLLTTYTRGVSLARNQIEQFNKADLLQRSLFLLSLGLLLGLLNWGTMGATTAYFIGALAAAIYSGWLLSKVARLRPRYIPSLPKKLISLGLIYALALFILNLNYRVDIILLERLTDVSQVGLYAVGVRLAEFIWQLPAALGVVLFSRSARSASEQEAVARTTRVLRISLPLILFGCAVLFIIAPWILPIFGPEFTASTLTTRYLLPGVATAVIFKVLYSDLAGRGRPLYAIWVFGSVAAVNIILNLLLIPYWGIEGAAVASSISYSLGALIFSSLYARLHNISLRNIMLINSSDIRYLKTAARLSKKTAAPDTDSPT